MYSRVPSRSHLGALPRVRAAQGLRILPVFLAVFLEGFLPVFLEGFFSFFWKGF